MELILDNWTIEDGNSFNAYLRTLARPAQEMWQRRIVATSLPLLSIATPDMRDVAKTIFKGNYRSFLDLELNDYYDDQIVNACLISRIKDFDVASPYVLDFASRAECWATCDCLKFNVTAKNAPQWWDLSGQMLSSDKCFVRRIGLDIMFKMVKPTLDKDYFDGIFERLNALENEQEYYVNMAAAWLFAECMTHRRDEMCARLQSPNTLNKFILNKGVQKCRDSFRITPQDKEFLLRFKVK